MRGFYNWLNCNKLNSLPLLCLNETLLWNYALLKQPIATHSVQADGLLFINCYKKKKTTNWWIEQLEQS